MSKRPDRAAVEKRDLIFTADGLPEIDDSLFTRLGFDAADLLDPDVKIKALRLLKEYFAAVKEGNLAMQAKIKADFAPLVLGLEGDLKRKRIQNLELDRQLKELKIQRVKDTAKRGYKSEADRLKDEVV